MLPERQAGLVFYKERQVLVGGDVFVGSFSGIHIGSRWGEDIKDLPRAVVLGVAPFGTELCGAEKLANGEIKVCHYLGSDIQRFAVYHEMRDVFRF